MEYAYNENFTTKGKARGFSRSNIPLLRKLDRNLSFFPGSGKTIAAFFSEVPEVKRDIIANDILRFILGRFTDAIQ